MPFIANSQLRNLNALDYCGKHHKWLLIECNFFMFVAVLYYQYDALR